MSHSYGLKYCTDSKTIVCFFGPFPPKLFNIKIDLIQTAGQHGWCSSFDFHCQSLYSFIYVELDYFSQIVDSLALYLFS